jgi:hypothetical protein
VQLIAITLSVLRRGEQVALKVHGEPAQRSHTEQRRIVATV